MPRNIIVSEINNFAYYKASGGCARILQGNMPLSAAKIRRSKRQNEKSFVVYYIRLRMLQERTVQMHSGLSDFGISGTITLQYPTY